MFVDILKGVQYLHQTTEDKPRIIHRELNPMNILIKYETNSSYIKIGHLHSQQKKTPY